MATEILANPQSKVEQRTYFCDFTNDLPDAVTVQSAVITHTPPSGNPTTPPLEVHTPMVWVTVGPLSVLGQHKISVLATLSNTDKSEIVLRIPVLW